jgi:hypothetical protein
MQLVVGGEQDGEDVGAVLGRERRDLVGAEFDAGVACG